MKEILTTNGKSIKVFDDLYTFGERSQMFSFIQASMYSPAGSDNDYARGAGASDQLASRWGKEDLDRFGILALPGSQSFIDDVKGLDIAQIRVNLTTLSEGNTFHVDSYKRVSKTLLYYPNMSWQIEWGGYTLFANDDISEIEYTSIYKPGRLVLFDGSIPHAIATQNRSAPVHRYTFVIQYHSD